MELPVEEGGFDVEPDRLSYALTVLTCARCSDAVFGARAAEVNLKRMEARATAEAQKRDEVSSYAALPVVTLDVECFNVVLTAISRCRQRDAPDRAMEIIQRMEKYAEMGDDSVRPNIRSWNGTCVVVVKGIPWRHLYLRFGTASFSCHLHHQCLPSFLAGCSCPQCIRASCGVQARPWLCSNGGKYPGPPFSDAPSGCPEHQAKCVHVHWVSCLPV